MPYWTNDVASLAHRAGLMFCSPESIGGHYPWFTNASPSNSNWPVANSAYFIPFVVHARCIARKMVTWAASGSGNIDVGIYNAQGVRLGSSGSTVENGFPQLVDISDVELEPDTLYYMAMARSGTGGVLSLVDWGNQYWPRIWGCRQMATAFPLPATATLAQYTTQLMPAPAILFELLTP